MRIEYRPKDEGWRGPGRPFKEVPPSILEMVRKTYGTDTMGVINLEDDDTSDDIREMLAMLRSAGKQLDGYTRIQKDIRNGFIRFILEDKND